MQALGRLARLAYAVSEALGRGLAAAAALAVAGIVLILVFSSVQRYALDQPIPATEELAGYLFVAFTFHEYWVDFKVFGSLGILVLATIAQIFYIYPYLNTDEAKATDSKD